MKSAAQTASARWMVCAFSLVCWVPSVAQVEPASEPIVFRSEVALATVRVQVTAQDRYVGGLAASDFQLTEDGRTVPITLFDGGQAAVQGLAVEVILLVDTSGSITDNKLLNEEMFRVNLLEDLPGVSLSIYRFGSSLIRMISPTRDAARIRAAFDEAVREGPGEVAVQLGPVSGSSLIYEAIAATIADAAQSRTTATKLLVVVSDGFQNGGADSPKSVENIAQEAGIPIYPIAVKSSQTLQPRGKILLSKFMGIGAATGGKAFSSRRLDDKAVRGVIEFLADQVRYSYVLGFNPERHDQLHRHKVKVRLHGQTRGKILGGQRVLVH